MISFLSISKYILTFIPELSAVIPIFHFYRYFLTSVYYTITHFNYQTFQKEISKIIFSFYKNEGSFYDFWFSCNIIAIVTSVIWIFLKYTGGNDEKSYNAFVVLIITSSCRFASVLVNQITNYLKSFRFRYPVNSPRFRANPALLQFLQQDNTCMLIITELIFETKESTSKIALLLLHSVFSLLGVFDFEITKRSIPYRNYFLFVFGVCENWLLAQLWIENAKSQAILYSLCYLLKWYGNTARQPVLLAASLVSRFLIRDEVPKRETSKRIASFGFDCFSIISDAN
ncbi:hypothetical protein Cantr_02522 [Candida viswanathii]|uniref:Uncharacterized protein n=1 Tax=Candida viswanathii TaxID=5486 RepID=A0A367YNI7_9ASCO|nr:hypothetical protein Cantr_02522 [Candida viswanathii]